MKVFKYVVGQHGEGNRALQCEIPLTFTEADQCLCGFEPVSMTFSQPLGTFAIHDALGMPPDRLGLAVIIGYMEHEKPTFSIVTSVEDEDAGLLPYDNFEAELTSEEVFALLRLVMLGALEQMFNMDEKYESLLVLGGAVAGKTKEQFQDAVLAEAYRVAEVDAMVKQVKAETAAQQILTTAFGGKWRKKENEH